MKRVGIADLKAHLSQYLAEVEAGETIIVCDRRRPVARMSAEQPEKRPLAVQRARGPLPRLEDLPGPPPHLPVDVVEVLRELRRDRWE
jgi:prevent-host-death family protein